MTRQLLEIDVASSPRRGLSREEAAAYIGISAAKFDELVRDGRMPQPRRVERRKLWDVKELDVAFEELPRDGVEAMEGDALDRMTG